MNNFTEILIERFGKAIILEEINGLMPIIKIPTAEIANIAAFLKTNESCYFDSLSCITGIDNGPDSNTMEVIYVLYSIPYNHKLSLKVSFERNTTEAILPKVPSVSGIWHSANWDEREIFDLLGIEFTNHPDLRRILMPEDWDGYPLRKDYQHQETYHGITVKY
jgi:NADH-quinone oxidoreductase subunit C